MNGFSLVDRGLVPDRLVRWGIRRRLRQRLREERRRTGADVEGALDRFAEDLRARPIAEATAAANEQHYEVPPEFFAEVLGRHRKYSSGLWAEGVASLDEAEEAMLALTAQRAGLADGQEVLDLGCGWGSFSLYAAGRFPRARFLALSNSAPQRRTIEAEAARRGLDRLQVVTDDINRFDTPRRFDRIVSVEMFEHMKNYRRLLARVASWLKPDGLLFVHIFTHRRFAYHFEDRGEGDWMARHFFTGGTMPAADLLLRFQEDLLLVERWTVDGTHYQRTAEAWLRRFDERAAAVGPILARTYGEEAARWRVRWRLFFMACAELFGYAGGTEWQVTHYLFRRRH